MNSDTSNDEQDDLDHCLTKSIGHAISTNELENSTRVVYPLSKSPQRKLLRYTDQSRRNTYTLDEDSPSTDEENVSAVTLNRANEYLRLNSEGFDPQQSDHLFHHVTDARSTFSIPKSSRKLTRQVRSKKKKKMKNLFFHLHLGSGTAPSKEISCLDQRTFDATIISNRSCEKIVTDTSCRFFIREKETKKFISDGISVDSRRPENSLSIFKVNVFKRKPNSIRKIFETLINWSNR